MWPPEALQFLRELEDNNDRDWFKANRARYDEHLVAPGQTLADRLGRLGPARFFRPYNDVRFQSRPPIKEQLGIAIGYGEAGGYYVELSLDGLLVGAGLHDPTSDQVGRFRMAINDERRARGFERVLARARAAEMTLAAPALKGVPRGYPVDHPRLHRLRLRSVTVFARHPLEAWLHEPRCDEIVGAQLEAARPLVNWLAEQVGPPRAASDGR